MLRKILSKNFQLEILNEIYNYVKSPDLDFSSEAVIVFFKCAESEPNLLTFKHVVNTVFNSIKHFEESKNFTLLSKISFYLSNFLMKFLMFNQTSPNENKSIILNTTPLN